MSRDFVGTGWHFPVELDDSGHIKMAQAQESIEQSIWAILSASQGERVMRPDFGCGIHDQVFGVNNASLAGQVSEAVRQALAMWEPRIDVLDVNAAADAIHPNLLVITINYRIRATNSRFNLVYPFYLE